MVGMVLPEATRWRYSSSPVIPGICTSAIRHEVRGTLREFKNSSADAKASAVYPNDFMSPLIASRIASSSSRTETRGFAFGTSTPSCGFPRGRTRCDPGHSAGIFDCISEDKTKPGGPRLYFGLKQNCREGERGGRPSILAKGKKAFLLRPYDFRIFRQRDCRCPESCGSPIAANASDDCAANHHYRR